MGASKDSSQSGDSPKRPRLSIKTIQKLSDAIADPTASIDELRALLPPQTKPLIDLVEKMRAAQTVPDYSYIYELTQRLVRPEETNPDGVERQLRAVMPYAYSPLVDQIVRLQSLTSLQARIDRAINFYIEHRIKDLAQLLIHTADTVMRESGYCNMIIFLSTRQSEGEIRQQSAAQISYSVNFSPELLRYWNAQNIASDSGCHQIKGHVYPDQRLLRQVLKYPTSGEKSWEYIAQSLTSTGDHLGTVFIFRDSRTPFSPEVSTFLSEIAPHIATRIADMTSSSDQTDDIDTSEDRDIGEKESGQ